MNNLKHKIILILIICLASNITYSAGTTSGSGKEDDETNLKGTSVATSYKKAVKAIKVGKKLDKKGKKNKAKEKYKKAYDYLIEANNKFPNNPDILNYLGFSLRKLENYEDAEIYYLLGLNEDPNHVGINEYLGELYVKTNRLDKAKERLKILKGCNCNQYNNLFESIKSGSSKY